MDGPWVALYKQISFRSKMRLVSRAFPQPCWYPGLAACWKPLRGSPRPVRERKTTEHV